MIKNYYKNKDFNVWDYPQEYNNIYEKKIAFIAKKNKELLLIHCHQERNAITLDDVKSLIIQREQYIERHPILEEYSIKVIYVISNFNIEESAFWYIQENKNKINYEIVKQKM